MTYQPRFTTAAPILLCAVTLLSSCGSESRAAAAGDTATTAAATAEPVATRGEATYVQICATCHQASGIGVEGTYPPLKHSSWLAGDPSVPISIVIAGLQGEIIVDGKVFNGAMQPWGMLSDDDIANVLTYARSQWGNSAGPVTAAQVTSVRAKIGNRGTWTAAELKQEYPGAGG